LIARSPTNNTHTHTTHTTTSHDTLKGIEFKHIDGARPRQSSPPVVPARRASKSVRMPLGRGRAQLSLASRFTRVTLDAVAQRARGILPTLFETRRNAPVASSTVRAREDAAAGERRMDESMRSSEAPGASTSRPTTENLPREFRFDLPRVKGATEVEDATHECARTPPGRDAKRGGFAFFESMGAPRFHVAPMVDQSELAFRELCRRYGATLGYTPMIHARLFVESPKYRREVFSTSSSDRPLLAQFCANDPDVLLEAAMMIAPYCDGVDINFGCPQRIAKRGNYGAYLMDDWKTVEALIRKLDEELPVPVTAKIRVYDDLETTLKYAKMVEAAGAQIVAVHGRTREQKRCAEIRANWCASSSANAPFFSGESSFLSPHRRGSDEDET